MTVLVCDVAARPGELVRHYEVNVDGFSFGIDLCDDHAGPFSPVGREKKVTAPAPRRRPTGAATAHRKVVTLADIERMKRERSGDQ